LQDLYRRGLEGKSLLLIVADGCPGLAATIQTIYPRAVHQRYWVHKMRKSDYDAVKAEGQRFRVARDTHDGRDRRKVHPILLAPFGGFEAPDPSLYLGARVPTAFRLLVTWCLS
jgi:transposase-like protein